MRFAHVIGTEVSTCAIPWPKLWRACLLRTIRSRVLPKHRLCATKMAPPDGSVPFLGEFFGKPLEPDKILRNDGYEKVHRWGKEAHLRHINFHIGAPRIASRIVQTLGKMQPTLGTPHVEMLSQKDYKNYFRHLVNGSNDILTLATQDGRAQAAFLGQLRGAELLVASQPGLMGHPRDVFRDGLILPGAEDRVARLSQIFIDTDLDLHLAITHPADYLRALQGDISLTKVMGGFHGSVPSWLEFATRLRRACPNRRLLVWDFEAPDKVALAFAMTMLSVDETHLTGLKAPVAEALQVSTLLPMIMDQQAVPNDLMAQLDARYEEDLNALDQLDNTVLIRSNLIPEDLWLTSV